MGASKVAPGASESFWLKFRSFSKAVSVFVLGLCPQQHGTSHELTVHVYGLPDPCAEALTVVSLQTSQS